MNNLKNKKELTLEYLFNIVKKQSHAIDILKLQVGYLFDDCLERKRRSTITYIPSLSLDKEELHEQIMDICTSRLDDAFSEISRKHESLKKRLDKLGK